MWRRTVRTLGDEYHVVAPDLPGFRPGTGEFSLEGAAESVVKLAEDLGGVHLCGLSLGGTVAIRAAATSPPNIASLMLCAPAVAAQRYQPHLLRRYRRIPDPLARLFSDATSWRALIDEIAKIDITDDFPAIRSPTLVVCGARDRTSLADAKRTAAGIAGARLVTLPHLGHGWPVTAPKVFRSVLGGFLASVEP